MYYDIMDDYNIKDKALYHKELIKLMKELEISLQYNPRKPVIYTVRELSYEGF
jgi:hypothetical protein